MGSNPIADMSGWSHSARKRKLALSPGVALRSKQVRLTCVAGVTGKGEETKGTPALAFSLSLFLIGLFLSGPRVVKGVNLTLRMGSNPIAHMKVTSGVALRSTQRLTWSPSVTSNACVTSNGYLPAAVSLPEWLRGDLRSTARKCAWVRTP